MRAWTLAAVLLISPAAIAETPDPALESAVGSKTRLANNIARDQYRHPFEELTFFGVRPDATVVEIWPGGGYWTEILAPYLHDKGSYVLALPGGADGERSTQRLDAKLKADPTIYGNVKTVPFGPRVYTLGPPASADLVVTFRNLHNWMDEGAADQALAAVYTVLKPGGILGVEDHRANADAPDDPHASNGYVKQDTAIALARKAGFELVATSEIDANPRDTKNYAKGVWTLPPTYSLGDQDRAKYAAIGEADNFVLKFRKPAR